MESSKAAALNMFLVFDLLSARVFVVLKFSCREAVVNKECKHFDRRLG